MLAFERSTDIYNDVTRTSPSVTIVFHLNRLFSVCVVNCRGPQKSDLLELLTQIRQGKVSANIFVRLERLQVKHKLKHRTHFTFV